MRLPRCQRAAAATPGHYAGLPARAPASEPLWLIVPSSTNRRIVRGPHNLPARCLPLSPLVGEKRETKGRAEVAKTFLPLSAWRRSSCRLMGSKAGPHASRFACPHSKGGPYTGFGASTAFWEDATGASAAVKKRQTQQQHQEHPTPYLGDDPLLGCAGPAAAIAAKVLSHPRAMEGLYVSSFYLAFLAAAHEASPAATAATAASAEVARAPSRPKGALHKRQAATQRLLMLSPTQLPAVAHVAATAAARMQQGRAGRPKGGPPGRGPEGVLWQQELAAILCGSSAAAAGAGDRAFWAAFCQAAEAAAAALSPAQTSRILAAAAAAAAAGAPGWKRLYQQHQKMLAALQQHIRQVGFKF